MNQHFFYAQSYGNRAYRKLADEAQIHQIKELGDERYRTMPMGENEGPE
jgi:hypothetical protein